MTHRLFAIIVTTLVASGCAASTLERDTTRVDAPDRDLVVEAYVDPYDPDYWAIEVRPRGADELGVLVSSEDEGMDAETAARLATIRTSFGAELAAARAWYTCALAECTTPFSECVATFRESGCR